MKQTILIFSDYTEIKQKGGRLYIKTNKSKGSIPVVNIDGILVFGKSSITSSAISLCMSHDIPIIFLTTYGKVKGVILPSYKSTTLGKRLKQVRLNLFNRLEVSKYIVKRKCLEIEYNFDLRLEDLKLKIEKVKDFSHLLGLEGYASKLMYSSFSEMLSETSFYFKERSYNPPLDEVNALLSFVYTLGYNLAISTILMRGFDPYVSFLHIKKGSHAAFASDVLEIVRPKLTYFTGKLLQQKVLSKTDFEKKDKEYFMKKSTLPKVIESFNSIKEELIDLMKEFLLELESFKEGLKDESSFVRL